MAKNNSIFLDTNILLEILLNRKGDTIARDYLAKHAGSLHISALTAHLVTHFGIEFVDLSVLKIFLNDYYIEALTDQDFEWAFLNARDSDFEDALQLAVAIRTGCRVFATFDKSLYETYKGLPVIKVALLKQ